MNAGPRAAPAWRIRNPRRRRDLIEGRRDIALRNVELTCRAATPSSFNLSHWSFIKRDERRDDDRRAGKVERGQLVAERLARAVGITATVS